MILPVSPSTAYMSDAVVLAAVCDVLPATQTIGWLMPSVVVTRGEALRFLIVPASAPVGPPTVAHQLGVTVAGLPAATLRPMRVAMATLPAVPPSPPPAGHPMTPRSMVMAMLIPPAVV